MLNKTSQEIFAKFVDGSALYPLPVNSSTRRAVIETYGKADDTSTNNERQDYQSKNGNHMSLYTGNFKSIKPTTSIESEILDYIAQSGVESREKVVLKYESEIRTLILQDEFIDGEVSRSEHYIINGYERGQIDFIADALMRIYSSNLGNPHILEGILTMIASVPYEAIYPKGQIMAMALLPNKVLSVRDKAIQCFEKWNSKKGLAYLTNISCSPKWLQNYVDKVIMYIERDGIE